MLITQLTCDHKKKFKPIYNTNHEKSNVYAIQIQKHCHKKKFSDGYFLDFRILPMPDLSAKSCDLLQDTCPSSVRHRSTRTNSDSKTLSKLVSSVTKKLPTSCNKNNIIIWFESSSLNSSL